MLRPPAAFVRLTADEQDQQARLLAVLPRSAWGSGGVVDILAEVERRAEVFKARWQATPDRRPAHTPKAAAYRSVYHDVIEGLLP